MGLPARVHSTSLPVSTLSNRRLMSWMAFLATLSVFVFGVASLGRAENWTNWRGPNLNGTVKPGHYPTVWDEKKNIAWSAPLPGRSGSTPIVFGDKIVLTVPIDGKNGVIAFDRSGKKLWQTLLGDERPGKHKKASGANPSPVTDGKLVYVYFKSGDFAALDWDGKIVWHQNLQKEIAEDTLWWDLGTSPVLTEKHIVVAVMQTGPSYLAAFEPATGKMVWKVDRILDAPEESAQSYTTPLVTRYKGQEQIIVLGADHVTCHDAKNGKELWRVGTLNPDRERYFRSIASPVVTGDIVIAPYARGKTLTAIRMGGTGDVTKSHVLWTKEIGSDVPTPVALNGKVYVAGDKGVVTCLNAETGEEHWSETLEKNRNAFSASPVMAGNLLYFVREDSKAFVIDVESKKVTADNIFVGKDESTYSTPVLIDNKIYLRTTDALYCIDAAE